MKHGYTNDTTTDGRRVIKRYRGPDAELRRQRELMIYDKLAGQLPLPRIFASSTEQLELQWLPGVPGQELLEDQAEASCRDRHWHVHLDLDQLPDAPDPPGGSSGPGDFDLVFSPPSPPNPRLGIHLPLDDPLA